MPKNLDLDDIDENGKLLNYDKYEELSHYKKYDDELEKYKNDRSYEKDDEELYNRGGKIKFFKDAHIILMKPTLPKLPSTLSLFLKHHQEFLL